jgi:Cys-tRNA synthase (O-phospho-L-seryl-tRNA:Cys-tRNA synthase)
MISANMHSVMNSFATEVLKTKFKDKSDFFIYEELSKSGAHEVRNQVTAVALKQGMISLPDTSELLTYKF